VVVQEDVSLDFGGFVKIVIAWDHSGKGKIPYRLPLGKHWQSVVLERIVGQLGALTKGKTFIVEGQQHAKKNGQAISNPNHNI
jgi:hypothetical protein